jgi:V8-like Glu-specific endopeptidase
VEDNQLGNFPYNLIGYIKFKLKNGNSDPIGQGTGFLISESVILTSSHCFVSWPNQNSDVTEIIPISFTIFQAGKVGVI